MPDDCALSVEPKPYEPSRQVQDKDDLNIQESLVMKFEAYRHITSHVPTLNLSQSVSLSVWLSTIDLFTIYLCMSVDGFRHRRGLSAHRHFQHSWSRMWIVSLLAMQSVYLCSFHNELVTCDLITAVSFTNKSVDFTI